ncbi:MAG: hypothetical protein K2M42_06725 [Oscillospiraceae bacterium]|nr:hypothetical protein [Oscillospiraceae bacterium]
MSERSYSKRSVKSCLGIVSAVLAVVPIVYLVGHAGKIAEYPAVIVFAVLGALAEIAAIFARGKHLGDYIDLVGGILLSLAFALFLRGGALSIADYFARVNFWGDATQFPAIMGYSGVFFLSMVLGVVNCYLD